MGENTNNNDTWLGILIGIFAVLAIKSIFEHDNSKIVSKKGSRALSDKKKMQELNSELRKLENDENSHREVLI